MSAVSPFPRLGVLDFCKVRPGDSPRAALLETTELAERADELGYSRYWLAEHHTAAVAHASAAVLTAIVAGLTERIRVGPAGVLAAYANAFKTAEDFRLLEALFPDRIDLGLARGFVDEGTAGALLEGRSASDALQEYPEKLAQIVEFVDGRGPVLASPVDTGAPEVWALGSGGPSAAMAGAQGTAFGLSLFFGRADATPAAIDEYRAAFRPGHLVEPMWNVAVAGVCAPSRQKAEAIAARHDSSFVVPTIVGDPGACGDALRRVAEAFGTHEVIFLDVCDKAEDRVRCYELLASVGSWPDTSSA